MGPSWRSHADALLAIWAVKHSVLTSKPRYIMLHLSMVTLTHVEARSGRSSHMTSYARDGPFEGHVGPELKPNTVLVVERSVLSVV